MYIVQPEEITIYIIGRNTGEIGLANLKNLKYLYPKYMNSLIYLDDDSVDGSFELITNAGFQCIKSNINQIDILEFNNERLEIGSIRNILNIKKALSECKTDYAIIMHSDMFVLNNQFLYKMFNDTQEYKVLSLGYFSKKNEIKSKVELVNFLKEILNSSKSEKEKEYFNYYLKHIKDNGVNNVWTGLTLINLKYFKDNNLPYCDRLDKRNKHCVSYLFADAMQDFQCFLIDNNIPFKTYDPLETNEVFHLVSKSILNSYKKNDRFLIEETPPETLEAMLKASKDRMFTKSYIKNVNLIVKNTGCSKKIFFK